MGAVLPINGTDSTLNNNYLLSIRWDYLIHALVYLPMFGLLRISNNKGTWINFLTGLSLAVVLEGIQFLTPWRTFNINDLAANLFGVFFGFVLFLAFYHRIDLTKFTTK